MRIIFFSVLLSLFTMLVSCDKPVEERQYQFPLELYHCADTSINGSNLRICFDSLYDSRCPVNMECIWQGEAIVKLSLQVNGQKQNFKLSTLNAFPNFRNDTTVLDYRVKLLSVTPYPGDNSQSPHKVELLVSR